MKKLILSLALLLPLSASASGLDCESVSRLAKAIMDTRQVGVGIVDALKATKDNELATSIILAAYRTPAFSVEANQDTAAIEFSNEWYLMCVEAKEED